MAPGRQARRRPRRGAADFVCGTWCRTRGRIVGTCRERHGGGDTQRLAHARNVVKLKSLRFTKSSCATPSTQPAEPNRRPMQVVAPLDRRITVELGEARSDVASLTIAPPATAVKSNRSRR